MKNTFRSKKILVWFREKLGPQSFVCYIFCFGFLLKKIQFHPLESDFYINFGSHSFYFYFFFLSFFN